MFFLYTNRLIILQPTEYDRLHKLSMSYAFSNFIHFTTILIENMSLLIPMRNTQKAFRELMLVLVDRQETGFIGETIIIIVTL